LLVVKRLNSILVVFAALCGVAANAIAADSTTLQVTATVVGNCKITGTAPVAFGNLDPANGAAVNASGSVTFWCTKGAGWTLSSNLGTNASGAQMRMKGPGAADYIPYGLTLASTTGTGAGVATTVTVNANGTIAAGAFANATIGAYSDTVTVSITP
jgi:spore coat protein U-like protein